MKTDDMPLRTIFLDREADDKLQQEAHALNISKARLFRDYLGAGLKAVTLNPELLHAGSALSEEPLLLRTVHMEPLVDNKLRAMAFKQHTAKNDILRRCLRIGMVVF